jgi:hypothetical protein
MATRLTSGMTNGMITSFDYPPIPIRSYDWSAIREYYEPGDLIGHGATEQEAIDNLKQQEDELL